MEISHAIKYAGVDDTDLDLFENHYPLTHGMAYNSYIILDDKIAITDTVDIRCGDEWLSRLDSILAGRQPDYLIVHHMEPDHSANIARAMEKYPGMQLVAGAKAISMLPLYFENATFLERVLTVSDGDALSLGSHNLRFFSAPMVHWPEVMVSYEETEQVLFSADAFGKFGALCYDDDWTPEARRYYANIVGKYGPQVQKALTKLGGVPIRTIAPLHGPVLSGDLTPYWNLYGKWSAYIPENDGVLVAYASIYGGTREAALCFAEMLREQGASDVVTFDLCRGDVSEAVSQLFRLGRLVVAAPTYDTGIYPAMHDFLYHLQIKNCRNRRVAVIENGSWAPVAGKLMADMLSCLSGFEIVGPAVTIRGRLHTSDLPALRTLATSLLA